MENQSADTVHANEEQLNQFSGWNLSSPILKALQEMNFRVPTPIQSEAIPLALAGGDLIGCAQTGTGKTAAFSIPLIASLSQSSTKTALILTPTRELATQISEVLLQLTHFLPDMKMALLIGGASMVPQFKALQRRPRIVIATPGRLMDHLRRRTVDLRDVGVLVLDEADRMLDMGFAPQLEEIQKYLPAERQTMLFSATLPGNIKKLASRYLRDPKHISVGPVAMPAPKITHVVVQTTQAEKLNLLLKELGNRKGSILVFAKTKHGTDKLANVLEDRGHSVARIHGDRSQKQRDTAVQEFRQGQARILVATDVVARGLDVPNIAHVINYDLPMCPEDYVHRIGRTARAGASGQAVCLLTSSDVEMWRRIARMYKYDVSHLKTMPKEIKGTSKSKPARRGPAAKPVTSGRWAHQGSRKSDNNRFARA